LLSAGAGMWSRVSRVWCAGRFRALFVPRPDATKHSLLLEGVGRPESSLAGLPAFSRPLAFPPRLRLSSRSPRVGRRPGSFAGLSGCDDSCECSGDAPPTRSFPRRVGSSLSGLPGAFRALQGTRPTEGIYADLRSQSSPKTTRCCGILPAATTTSRHGADGGGYPPVPCGPAGDALWTTCGPFPVRRPCRRLSPRALARSAPRGSAVRNVRSILPQLGSGARGVAAGVAVGVERRGGGVAPQARPLEPPRPNVANHPECPRRRRRRLRTACSRAARPYERGDFPISRAGRPLSAATSFYSPAECNGAGAGRMVA
jgi:hypothetical protein